MRSYLLYIWNIQKFKMHQFYAKLCSNLDLVKLVYLIIDRVQNKKRNTYIQRLFLKQHNMVKVKRANTTKRNADNMLGMFFFVYSYLYIQYKTKHRFVGKWFLTVSNVRLGYDKGWKCAQLPLLLVPIYTSDFSARNFSKHRSPHIFFSAQQNCTRPPP